MTPFEIDVLLHYYSRGGDHDVVRRNPPIWFETRTIFLREGLLVAADSIHVGTTYAITDRGTAYCEALQQVPLPEQQWVIHWPSDQAVRKDVV